ncbi:26498_t:CDS:2 [Gigaspora margarita]|uniref:26498_t:CDS:1 n=1 Tax=Gigaspora margarita TaxID=4874 RepID=A0ABN7UNT7_GIGMA|nr:26498_t:CDS:2 [Gigaspora margarita]
MGLTLDLAKFYRFLIILKQGKAHNSFFTYKLIHESGPEDATTAYVNEPEDVKNGYKYLAEIFKIGSKNSNAANKMVRESFIIHLSGSYIEQNVSIPQNEIADSTIEERIESLCYVLGGQTAAKTYHSIIKNLGIEQNMANCCGNLFPMSYATDDLKDQYIHIWLHPNFQLESEYQYHFTYHHNHHQDSENP